MFKNGWFRHDSGSNWNLKLFFKPKLKLNFFLLNCLPGVHDPSDVHLDGRVGAVARLALAWLVLGEVLRLLGDRVEARLLLAPPRMRRAPRLPVMVVVVVVLVVAVVGLFVGSVAAMEGRFKEFRRPGKVPLATSDSTKGGRPKSNSLNNLVLRYNNIGILHVRFCINIRLLG